MVTRSLANPPLSAPPTLGKRLPDAVPPPELAASRRRGIAVETERNRVPQHDGVLPLVSRTQPVTRIRCSALRRQGRPPMLPSSLCVLVPAPTLHRHVPLAIPTNNIGNTEAITG